MSLEVRPMEEGDLDALAALEALCFSEPWSRKSLEEELSNPHACFLAAAEDGEVLGYGGMHFAWGEFYLDNLAVFPRHRRKGAARAILLALRDFALAQGGKFLTLEVRPSNAAAIALYTGLGFRETGRRKNFYTRPAEDALLLQLDLEPGEITGEA